MIKQSKIYIHLTSISLKTYLSRPHLNNGFIFPLGIMEHQEIKKKDTYKNLVSSFMADLPPGELILLIADEFIYKKSLAAGKDQAWHNEKQDFLTMLPFDELKIAHKQIETLDKSEIIAVNKDLYSPILAAAALAGRSIKYIIPLSLIHKDPQAQPEHKLLNKNYSAKLLQKHDLGSADHGIPWRDQFSLFTTDSESRSAGSVNTRLFALFAVFAISLLTLIFLLLRNADHEKAVVLNNTTAKAPVVAPTFIPTPTAIPYKQLADLKVNILNASSISGQANRLKQSLADLGLSGITTGNQDGNYAEGVSLQINRSVSASDSALFSDKIQLTFPDLAFNQSATDSSEFDILVIIGNNSVLE